MTPSPGATGTRARASLFRYQPATRRPNLYAPNALFMRESDSFWRRFPSKFSAASQRSKFALRAGHSEIEHRVPRRVAIAAFDDHVLAEYTLKNKSEAEGGPPRGFVQRIAFPFITPVFQVLEDVPGHEVHGLGRSGGPLKRGRVEDAAHFNAAVDRFDAQECGIAHGHLCPVENREEERVARCRHLLQPRVECRAIRIRPVEQISPEIFALRAMARLVKSGGVGRRIERDQRHKAPGKRSALWNLRGR